MCFKEEVEMNILAIMVGFLMEHLDITIFIFVITWILAIVFAARLISEILNK